MTRHSLRLLFPAFAIVWVTSEGCRQQPASPTAFYKAGAPIAASDFTPIQTVLQNPSAHTVTPVRVEGIVRQACLKKGCWMELAASNAGGQGCRVTFKDYGFFVPTDAAGTRARVEGNLSTKLIPSDQVKHLEAEGAHFTRKNADGSATEVRLVATGVELFKG